MIRTTMIGLAAAAVLLTASPAVATPPEPGHAGGGQGPRADLTLTYMANAGFATAVKLDCYPPGGGHPQPAQACAELAAAGGNPDRIKPRHSMCMMIYLPVTAQISGHWLGTAVAWQHEYGNSCEMHRALGVLFDF
ncbi:subtilase-type protease inhibitor [Actinoplanes sp. KI2]|uniref:subtilase-type protease inhibitor n=1 Tax=Actinoplanes sp. KI2 TaxID=2983315 RepID=UPI0021D5C9C8|nr:subtilase-type protease inhibitor [Actinoplanes sp. KI2]MCU7723574.1 subtilase-type protease inhibitor [Actinoplanes sp. KI2]